MKFGSVCSGIEAASVAWNSLGWEAEWLAEIEPFPSAVLAHHYPSVPNLGDMTKIVEKLHTFEISAPDILCGGTPCQAFSVAGLRKSLDDARGNLSLTFCEIANAIDDIRTLWNEQPAIIFWENVPGVLSTKDNAFGCFLAGLAGEDDPLVPPGDKWANAGVVHGPQRTVAWRVLDAQYFGVAQRRRRVFVVASARADFDPIEVLFEFDGVRRDTAPSREAGQKPTGPITAGIGKGCRGTEGVESGWAIPVAFQQTADCLTAAYGTKWNGNASATNGSLFAAHPVSYGIRTANTSSNGWGIQEEATHTLDRAMGVAVAQPLVFDTTQVTSPLNYSNPQPGDPCHPLAAGAHVPAVALPINTQIATRHNCLGEGTGFGIGNETDPSFTLTKGHSHAVAFQPTADCLTAAYGTKWNGNASATNGSLFAAHAAAIHENQRAEVTLNDTAGTVKCAGGKPGQGYPAAMVGMQVRRLTPVECERLQGFPDGYTDIKPKGKPTPDGPRYKALGNSWAVPVVHWIGKRIAKELAK